MHLMLLFTRQKVAEKALIAIKRAHYNALKISQGVESDVIKAALVPCHALSFGKLEQRV